MHFENKATFYTKREEWIECYARIPKAHLPYANDNLNNKLLSALYDDRLDSLCALDDTDNLLLHEILQTHVGASYLSDAIKNDNELQNRIQADYWKFLENNFSLFLEGFDLNESMIDIVERLH